MGLAVDVYYPLPRLLAALADFRTEFPSVAFRLYVEALGAVAERVLAGSAQLGILATLPELPAGLEGYALPPVKVVAVAAPTHPLALQAGPIERAALRPHTQLVLTDRSALTAGKDYAVLSDARGGYPIWRETHHAVGGHGLGLYAAAFDTG